MRTTRYTGFYLLVLLAAACTADPAAPVRGPDPVIPGTASLVIRTRNVLVMQDSSFQMLAEALDGRGVPVTRRIRWHSDNWQVLPVDTLGVVNARRAGAVMVRASLDGMSDSTMVYITNRVGGEP